MSVSTWVNKIVKHRDILVAFGVIGIVILMIIPLHPMLLDILIVFNITCSLMILLVSMYNKETLDFSVFPSLLLIMTLYRLSLNVSSTRLILLKGKAGEVIQQFGEFVIGGNPFVGFVIFLILVVIQFIVITKGAERVAEVAARFTLDAMPGKQMSIDADLNAGLISEEDARTRRLNIQREADFYGAMDGASKFVKGDAIASIIITIINIMGGMAVGLLQRKLEGGIGEVAQVYTLLTVGDGLVSQIPALLLSTATGIIVTRAASDQSLGNDLTKQIFSEPKLLSIAAGVLFFLGMVPGLPKLPFFVIGAGLALLAFTLFRSQSAQQEEESVQAAQDEAAQEKKPENVFSLLHVDPIELELGYGLIPLVDSKQGGDLLERIVMIRRQCALELGVVIPPVRIRDNMQLSPNTYVLKLKGIPVEKGEIMLGHYLAMGQDDLPGIPTQDPAFGLPAVWVSDSHREQAEMAGATVVDPPAVMATHVTEFLKKHAADILTRQDIRSLLDNLKKEHPTVVEEVIPNLLSLAELHKIIANLLNERIPVRDMISILEALGDWAPLTKDPDILTEYVRQKLCRQIGQLFGDDDGKIYCITIDSQVEEMIRNSIQSSEHGNFLAIEPGQAQKFIKNLNNVVNNSAHLGKQIVLLVPPVIRSYLRKLTERTIPNLPILSFNEIPPHMNVESVGMVKI